MKTVLVTRHDHRQELVKNANLLFSTLRSNLIWDYCGQVFDKATCLSYRLQDEEETEVNHVGTPESTVVEMCAILQFLLEIVNIDLTPEITSDHLPHLFKSIVQTLTTKCKNLKPSELTKSLQLAKKIMSRVRPPWNVWDIHSSDAANDTLRSRLLSVESFELEEVGKEATESFNGNSPEQGALSKNAPSGGGGVHEASSTNCDQEEDDSSKTHKTYMLVMLDCISVYQRFYIEFLKTKIFDFDQVEIKSHMVSMCRQPVAESVEEESVVERLRSNGVKLKSNEIFALQDAIKYCCEILVELSSIPTWIQDQEQSSAGGGGSRSTSPSGAPSKKASVGSSGGGSLNEVDTPENLPLWLQCLVISCCLVDHKYADFQLQSINTILEMVDLLESNVNAHKKLSSPNINAGLPEQSNGGGGGSTNCAIVIFLPMMKEDSYNCIFKRSVIPQVIAARLWDGLGHTGPVHHLACVSLLHHLHNVAFQVCPLTQFYHDGFLQSTISVKQYDQGYRQLFLTLS